MTANQSKTFFFFLLGLTIGLTFSIFAFTNPTQSPPNGSGQIYATNSAFYIPEPLNVQATTTITNGVLGVGLTNPAATLDVAGTLNVSATSTFGGNVGIGVSIPNASLNVIGT
ncbi:hypothetical protein M1525_01530, partial [Patescibacteria group bacterium]|nr:hypothetical protein [Patescibacteria group bacterium]